MKDYYSQVIKNNAAAEAFGTINDDVTHSEMVQMMVAFVILVTTLLNYMVGSMNLLSSTLGRALRQSIAVMSFSKNSSRGGMDAGDAVVGYKLKNEMKGSYMSVPHDNMDETSSSSSSEGETYDYDDNEGVRKGLKSQQQKKGTRHSKRSKEKKK